MISEYLDKARKIAASMTLEQKIGQMIMASIEVTEMNDKTRMFLIENCIGNIILFGKNCVNRKQLVNLNRQIQDEVTSYTGGIQALLSIDQEGGIVTRIRNGATVFSCAAAVGAAGKPEYAYRMGKIMGEELRSLGISYNLAPVLDTDGTRTGKIPNRRSFGATPEITSLYGGAYARGLRESGVIDTGKHFPGSGDSPVDTHFGTSVVHTSKDEAMEISVKAFKKVIDEGMRSLMIDHTCYTGLDPACIPASISKPIIQQLARETLGFEGLIISDGMQMLAIEDVYGAPRGCVLAAEAGCDLLIVGNGGDNADPDGKDVQTPCIKALIDAARSGELSMSRVDESATRIIAFKLMLGDLYPVKDAETLDWREHEQFSRMLAASGVKVQKNERNLLPIPLGALFLSRKSRARLGVEEGDKLVDGFAPMAAKHLNGTSAEFDEKPDLDSLKEKIICAPFVVFACASRYELHNLTEDIKAVCALNPNTCLVCQDVPESVESIDFAPLVITSYDQTINAIRSVINVLKGK
ncbi:MAG: glycoside hydrolase family 3 protein [Clostridia bacterium]|nr:glycoside hydrolase family 3 protein [Clostridia bacterium]